MSTCKYTACTGKSSWPPSVRSTPPQNPSTRVVENSLAWWLHLCEFVMNNRQLCHGLCGCTNTHVWWVRTYVLMYWSLSFLPYLKMHVNYRQSNLPLLIGASPNIWYTSSSANLSTFVVRSCLNRSSWMKPAGKRIPVKRLTDIKFTITVKWWDKEEHKEANCSGFGEQRHLYTTW